MLWSPTSKHVRTYVRPCNKQLDIYDEESREKVPDVGSDPVSDSVSIIKPIEETVAKGIDTYEQHLKVCLSHRGPCLSLVTHAQPTPQGPVTDVRSKIANGWARVRGR